MSSVEQAVRSAIAAIDTFLRDTAASPANVTAQTLRELSYRIEHAHSVRAFADFANLDLRPLREEYREKLEQLRKRLAECEVSLRMDSARLVEENNRITSVREWHSQFTATQ